MKIRGQYGNFTGIFINGLWTEPSSSRTIYDFSEEFDWGSAGPGAAQLAVAILKAAHAPRDEVLRFCTELKLTFIAVLPRGDFEVDFDVVRWLELQRARILAS